ncbi:hypothetical protein QBC42DRAFT_260226 [Cladorrhinum samala]|uniref:Secreted protein n=1 Tax=Cladorrhinum samala TaxID=585594 RepID=A0AAV9I196_9PEZI|nr:hypothetical protein QBC42DRAFT_260226 [Cladorrhinum samala]
MGKTDNHWMHFAHLGTHWQWAAAFFGFLCLSHSLLHGTRLHLGFVFSADLDTFLSPLHRIGESECVTSHTHLAEITSINGN